MNIQHVLVGIGLLVLGAIVGYMTAALIFINTPLPPRNDVVAKKERRRER